MTRFFAILCLALIAQTSADEIRLVRNGKAQPDCPGPTLVTNVIRFLACSSIQSSTDAVKTNTWQDLLASDSYVHVKLQPPQKIKLPGHLSEYLQNKRRTWQDLLITEILLPLPEQHGPDHIYARTGTNIVSYCKFNPSIFKQIILEPALKMTGTKVHREYSRPRKLNTLALPNLHSALCNLQSALTNFVSFVVKFPLQFRPVSC